MDEAEEACCQALSTRPANAKALFRRGQARLALGRAVEAASDFSEVCLLEPNNAEATKMLRLAQGGEQISSPPVGIAAHEGGREKPNAGNSCEEEALRPETGGGNSSGSKLENAEEGVDIEQNHVGPGGDYSAPPSGSSFMVSGWLESAERRQVCHPRGNDSGDIDVHSRHLAGSADHDRPPSARPGGVGGAASVSRLVSQLSLAQKGASSEAQDEPAASDTAAPAAQAEWSRLQAEEDLRVQESLRRWSTGGGSRGEGETTKAGVNGKSVDGREIKLRVKTAAKKAESIAVHRGGSKEVKQTSELWASLEEEENRVREAFRAKLGVGEKLSCKGKVKEKRKTRDRKR